MHHKLLISLSLPTWIAFWWAATMTVSGITVADLQKQLAKGGKLTVIDVRSPRSFAQAHIPGAINVPASLCAQKELPPLGQVVVYGDGLGSDATDVAATALAAKPGLRVEVLEGGFAAWESAQSLTTRARGLEPETLNYISYAQLKAAKVGDAVLVDLRKLPAPARAKVSDSATPSGSPLTDLSREFPGLRLTRSAFAVLSSRQSVGGISGAPPLLVLIDSGDGTAQAMARTLTANGVRRYVILAGGELALARSGQPGLQRIGSSSRPVNQIPAGAGPPN